MHRLARYSLVFVLLLGLCASSATSPVSALTLLPAPTTLAPTGLISDTTPTYSFSKVVGASQYQYQLFKGSSTTATYTQTVLATACGASANCVHTPSTVLTDSTYTWKVRAMLNKVWGAYSALKTFTLTHIPTPITPTGTIADTTPAYTFTKITGATQYQYQLFKGTSATPTYTQTLLSTACGASANCVHTPTTVLTDGDYKWKVRAMFGGVWKTYSALITFKILTIPTAITPAANISDTTPTYTFTKISGATQYRYQLFLGSSATATYTQTVLAAACGASANCVHTPATSLAYAVYTWKVQAFSNGVWLAYSPTMTFTLAPIPSALTPSTTITDTTPTYTFNKITGAIKYEYLLFKGSSTTATYTQTVLAAACGTSANCVHTPATVLTDSAYNWKVRAMVNNLWGAYSAAKSFTVSIPSALTVTTGGAGKGTVSSAPAGINCGATCSYNFTYNATVTLTASATAPNTFAGWSGAGCTGTSTCVLSMSAAKNVTAYFLRPTVALGYFHTCALTSAGAVKCWGLNNLGQLGDGTQTSRLEPVNVSNLSSGVVAISAGEYSTCALTVAGGVKCWGSNSVGQLGVDPSSTVFSSIPVNVSGLSSGVSAITIGDNQACALTTTGGVKCWGDNFVGQLGNNSFVSSYTPVNVSGLSSGISAISSGYAHTCALSSTGSVKCWGYNGYGQLGNASVLNSSIPVNVSGLSSGVSTISTAVFNSCAIKGGNAQCWGLNSARETITEPQPVSGLADGVSAIALGGYHTCVLTTSTPAGAQCWGDNSVGQLGNASLDPNSFLPVDVLDLPAGTKTIDAGYGHTCVMTNKADGTDVVQCWGYNSDGQLGESTLVSRNSPVYVSGLGGSLLTVTKAGNGSGTVTSDLPAINCGNDCGYTFENNISVTLTAVANDPSTFAGWSGAACTGTAPCTVTLDTAKNVIATFDAPDQTLTVARDGTGSGTVTSSPAGINCGETCTFDFAYNSVVTLSANPAGSDVFAGWSGEGCTGTGTCQVTMDAARNVTATFNKPKQNLTVSLSGPGDATVTSAPTGINCGATCSYDFVYNTSVTLTVNVTSPTTFLGWDGAGCTGTAACVVTMDTAKSVTALLDHPTQKLTVIAVGTGTISSSPAGIDCGATCSFDFSYKNTVTLTASGTLPYTFASWSDASCPGTGTCVVTMDKAQSITATFTIPNQTLTLTKNGNGSGTISSSIPGIDCGATCSYAFEYNAAVILTASATAPSVFTGWSGDDGCPGLDPCSVTMDAAKNVTANFSAPAVVTGEKHTCALDTAGGIKCWGHNWLGQLGDGTTTNQSTPVAVQGLTNGITAIALGRSHTCALTTTGGVKCWGSNWTGELGDGTLTNRSTPVDVYNLTEGVSAISVGFAQSCALMATGAVKCWGQAGLLGNGYDFSDHNTPIDVTGLSSGVRAISAAGYHTCALTTAGEVKCWGYNLNGEIGDGTTLDRFTPVNVSNLSSGVSAISSGKGGYTCALLSTGGVKCWGFNGSGQFGNGTTNDSLVPVAISNLSSAVSAISAGYAHSCALLTTGGVQCWGANNTGQFGNGTINSSLVPVAVSNLSSNVSAISTGLDYSCALRTTGVIQCWGSNDLGQLGDGTTTNSSVPVTVLGIIP